MNKAFSFMEMIIVVIIVVIIIAIIIVLALPDVDIKECMEKYDNRQYCIDKLKVEKIKPEPQVWASEQVMEITINDKMYECKMQ